MLADRLTARHSIVRASAALGAVAAFGVASTGVASASEEVPPPTGVYVCYDETTLLVYSPIVPLPVHSITVATPSGVYVANPPC